MPTRIRANEAKVGDVIQSIFLVKTQAIRTTRDGRSYLNLTLQDASGELEARAWENVESLAARSGEDAFIAIRGEVMTFGGTPYLSVHDLERVPDEEVELSEFFPHSRWSAEALEGQLFTLIETEVRSPVIRAFLVHVLTAPAIASVLRDAPAAKRNHHAWRAGLLEHIVSMIRLSIQISKHYDAYYPGLLNVDLVIAGCVLHDLGKCVELDFRRHTRYSTEGQLVGHIATGASWVDRYAEACEPALPPDLTLQLKHLVLSHHGRLEFGSPVTPRTVEAMVLHHVDMIDSRMNMCWNLRNDTLASAPGGQSEYWSDYQRSLEGSLHFRGVSAWETNDAYATDDLDGPGLARDGAERKPIAAQTSTDGLNLDLFSGVK